MMKKLINILLILTLAAGFSQAQEQLIGLDGNPQLRKTLELRPDLLPKASAETSDTLELPFFDDFALISVYPDQNRWTGYDVYINNQWGKNPWSYGVASFDQADSLGEIRPLSSGGEVSDYLTSKPINLEYAPEDSVFLSFVYQAGGHSKMPEEQDSLVLEMTSPDTTWIAVWNSAGGQIDSVFNAVIIPITDAHFLKKGFRFRFKNYASTVANSPEPSFNSNNDVWNLDYVYLDTARSSVDTLIEDVAFMDNFSPLLRDYAAMPWKHFLTTPDDFMRDSVTFRYRNNGETDVQVDRQVHITDLWGNGSDYSIINDNENIFAQEIIEYTRPLDDFTFDSDLPDSARCMMKGVLKTDTVSDREMFRWNDTTYFEQKFENYYAYDDGVPEAGYGIGGVGTASAALAYRFSTVTADTLRGVYIYFNHVLNYANENYFYLTVWEDDNGLPGDTLRYQIGVKPEFKESLYQYRYYALDTPVYIADTFHIGWVKTTDDMLNVGFDKSRDASENIHINMFGQWQESSFEGALMMRPVFSENEFVSVPEKLPLSGKEIRLYPNPARNYVNVSGDMNIERFQIISAEGRVVKQGLFSQRIDLSALPRGMYIVVFENNDGILSRKKLMIN
ncbi:MAG: T9SS type A sorting domain-containing protein [Bacteroidota bacterium]